METMIERLSWRQVAAAIESGFSRVILVVGAMEQHGPHMAIGTDTMLGYELAKRLAHRLGHTLIAPAITLGWSEGHLSHSGTINLSPSTLKNVVRDVCSSLSVHGFKEIIVLPSHGGNYRPLQEIVPSLRNELPATKITYPESDLDRHLAEMDSFYEEHGLDSAKMGVHAGQSETSRMLAVHPDLVDMSLAAKGFMGDASIRWTASTPPPMDTMSPSGILGDAREASRKLGEQLIEHQVDVLYDLIRREDTR